MRLPQIPIRLPKNRFLRWGVLPVITVVIVAVIVVGAVYELNRPSNSDNPDVAFTTTTTTKPSSPPKRRKHVNFSWPLYGYTLNRTRDFSDAPADLHPPFEIGWKRGGNALLEFSPSIYGNYIYYEDDSATVKKLSLKNGRQMWLRRLGRLSAATPALDPKQNLLFVPTLSTHGSTPGDGEFVALRMTTGKTVWKLSLPPGSESSPLYSHGIVYFGSQDGTVYAVVARTGHIRWEFHAAGAVKGGPALSGGILYFGDYANEVYAVHASSGQLVWKNSAGGGAFGIGSGSFYATPAVAFGRVYIGNTNGYMYSYSAKNGDLAWSRGTGAYVYGAASVAEIPHLGPTVFVGSYNGYFYALDARSGAVRWQHYDGGSISGASTIVGHIVYYASFHKQTTGLNVRTGKVEFTFSDGAYSPIIATPKALYLDGDYTLFQLLPKDAPKPQATQPAGGRRAPHTSSTRRKPKAS